MRRFRYQSSSSPWRSLVLLLWCALAGGALVLLAQWAGLINSAPLREAAFLALEATSPARESAQTAPPPAMLTEASPLRASAPIAAPEACTPESPRFVNGASRLRSTLGGRMGEAMECERPVDGLGSTEQRTTTGLVYYRAQTSTVAFTNGWDHWAVASNGLVHWTGEAVEPPSSAELAR